MRRRAARWLSRDKRGRLTLFDPTQEHPYSASAGGAADNQGQ